MKSYCTALALLGSAVPALAQGSTIKPDPWLLKYPSSCISGPATQACIGMFSDDLEADGALLAGGDVILLYAPSRVSSFLKVTGPFSSMAKVPLTGCPGAEGLLASSSAGLVLLHWDSTRQLAATPVDGSTEWADAEELQFVPGGTDSSGWICALSSARDVVYYSQWDGAAIEGTIAGSVQLTRPALTLAGLYWNDDSLPEFAVDDGTGAQLVDMGNFVTSLCPSSCSAPQLLRLPHPGGSDDLVWLTNDVLGPDQILTVFRMIDGTLELDVPIHATGMTVGRLTLADLDGNGLEDVVGTRSDAGYAQALYHQDSGSMTFGFWSPVDSGFCAPALPQVYGTTVSQFPVAAGGDIDGDGDDDLLFAGQPGCADRAEVLFGSGVKEEENGATPVKVWLNDADYYDWCWPNVPVVGSDVAQISLFPKPQPSTGPASTANKIRVTVWARDADLGPIRPMRLVDSFFESGSTDIDVLVPLSSVIEEGLPRYLVLQVSYVNEVNGAITRVLPGWTGQIDRQVGIPDLPGEDGPTTTGGINQPQPPPSTPPPSP